MKRRIDLTILDTGEQRTHIPVHVRLPRLDRQRLVHYGAHRQLVDKAAVDARHRHCPTLPTRMDSLAEDVRTVGGQKGRGFHTVEQGVRAGAVRFHPHGINAPVRAASTRHLG